MSRAPTDITRRLCFPLFSTLVTCIGPISCGAGYVRAATGLQVHARDAQQTDSDPHRLVGGPTWCE